MTKRHCIAAHKRVQVTVKQRTFYASSCNRVRPVEHIKWLMRLGRFFQRIEQRARISVETRSHVLNVVNQDVYILHFVGRKAALIWLEEADHRQSRCCIAAVRDARIRCTRDAMLRREERRNSYAGSQHYIHVSLSHAV